MRDPLNKRLPREFKNELGKYMVIFILMVFSIGLEGGYVVGDGSMIKAYEKSFEKFTIEDGNFTTRRKMTLAQKNIVEDLGIKVFENFYVEIKDEENRTYRLYKNRDEVDRVDLFEGRIPVREDEIALDRAFCANNGISLNDTLTIEKENYTVVGIVALSDYSSLFADQNDIMFDAVSFSVGIVSDDRFDRFTKVQYNYAYLYDEAPLDQEDEKQKADTLSKQLAGEVVLDSFTPRYLNHAITFTGDDMGQDRAMMDILFYIIIAIMAFVFSLTAATTIRKEMTVIGTLLASGYTKRELIVHYMKLPLLVTLVSALIGNIIGYTWMKDMVVGLYYNSYSLPRYTTIWSAEAFIRTTLIPIAMMVVIDLLVLNWKLRMPILNFLRKQNTSSRNRRAFPLSRRIPFIDRFRTRIFLKNIPSYLLMLVGILFANLLILFGLDFPKIIDEYEAEMLSNPLAPYITMLNMPPSMNRDDHRLENSIDMLNFYNEVQTENDSAEKISAYSLRTPADLDRGYNGESVTVYGVEKDSDFIDLDLDQHQIYVSSAYADKFLLEKGDHIILKEEYEDTYYDLEIDGTYDYMGALCVFMSREDLNKAFDMDKETFVGYLSNTAIEDIDDRYIGTVIDGIALTKLSRQLRISFGGLMDMVIVFAVVIYVVLIYILSKMMIESSAQSISMSKIMGYTNGEISSLYIVTTTIVFLILLVGSIPLEIRGLILIFRYMMTAKMSGWFPLTVSEKIVIETIAIAIASYTAVTLFELRRIARIPMDQALKNME